jgi:hypothetical protein
MKAEQALQKETRKEPPGSTRVASHLRPSARSLVGSNSLEMEFQKFSSLTSGTPVCQMSNLRLSVLQCEFEAQCTNE